MLFLRISHIVGTLIDKFLDIWKIALLKINGTPYPHEHSHSVPMKYAQYSTTVHNLPNNGMNDFRVRSEEMCIPVYRISMNYYEQYHYDKLSLKDTGAFSMNFLD